jgi:phospholipid-binding lipoprotein MlaA
VSSGSRRSRGLLAVALVVSLVGVVGVLPSCVSTEYRSRDWSAYDGPGAAYFHAEEVPFPHADDPLEPVNRVSAWTSDKLLRWVVSPIAQVYRWIAPECVRVHLAKAGENFLFPTRLVANLLQGKLRESGVEVSRFVVNTTVGVLGLFDPAQEWGLHPYPEDFGQTFAKWGWDDSTYLFLPFLGPSSVRDGLGEIPDTLTDPAFWYYPASYARGFNSLSNHIEPDLRTASSVYDPYEAARTLYSLQRVVDVDDFEWHVDDSGPTQTLQAIFLEPEEPDFASEASTEHVRLRPKGPELPYSLWMQPGPAPLMYVVPGVGGNRLSPSTLALAEIGFERGHSVVAVSSPTNWEFMRFGASVTVPGYGPADAHDLHVALTAIDRDLEARLPGRFGKRRVLGASLGGYHALLMAAREGAAAVRGASGLLAFDQCVALNPPVSLEHALMQLDRFYNAPLAFPADERAARIEEIYAKVLYLGNGDLEPGMELPFGEVESRFLIGLAFRLDLQFMILQSQDLEDSGMLLTERTPLHRAPAFREAAEYSFMEYVHAFLLPYFARREPDIAFTDEGARRLFLNSDLHAAEPGLLGNERVHVLTNENDFLLRPDDLDWLRETFGERLILFPDGGHLGNVYREYLQDVIGDTLEDAPRP